MEINHIGISRAEQMRDLWYRGGVEQRDSCSLSLAVFDLDGTLVEFEHEHFAQQIEVTLNKLKLFAPPRDAILRLINEHKVSSLFTGVEQMRSFWTNFEEGEPPPPRAFERSLESLEKVVAQGLDVVIATARKTPPDVMRSRLAHTGLNNHIEVIYTFHDTGWLDKVEQLRTVCRAHSTEPRHAMMVGDTEDDMRSAQMVGFGLRLGMLTGITPEERLRVHKPHKLLKCISEVPGALSDFRAGILSA